MVPAVPTKPSPDIPLVPVSKEGDDASLLRLTPRKALRRNTQRRRKGTQSHHLRRWEGGTSVKNLRTATCSMPWLSGRRRKERGKRHDSLGLREGSEAP